MEQIILWCHQQANGHCARAMRGARWNRANLCFVSQFANILRLPLEHVKMHKYLSPSFKWKKVIFKKERSSLKKGGILWDLFSSSSNSSPPKDREMNVVHRRYFLKVVNLIVSTSTTTVKKDKASKCAPNHENPSLSQTCDYIASISDEWCDVVVLLLHFETRFLCFCCFECVKEFILFILDRVDNFVSTQAWNI